MISIDLGSLIDLFLSQWLTDPRGRTDDKCRLSVRESPSETRNRKEAAAAAARCLLLDRRTARAFVPSRGEGRKARSPSTELLDQMEHLFLPTDKKTAFCRRDEAKLVLRFPWLTHSRIRGPSFIGIQYLGHDRPLNVFSVYPRIILTRSTYTSLTMGRRPIFSNEDNELMLFFCT